jgi:hypothetical protein
LAATRPYTATATSAGRCRHTATCGEGLVGHGAERNYDDLGGEHEVGAYGALDLVLFHCHQVDGGVGQQGDLLGVPRLVFPGRMQPLVGELFHAFETEVEAAQHQERRDRRRQQRADRQRRRHQDQLVLQRADAHRPDHRQFALGAHAGHLLRVQREVVAEHAGGLFRRDLGHQRHVVEDGGNVVEQCEQAGAGHGHVIPDGRTAGSLAAI